MSKNIKILRTTTREDVLAEVISENASTYTIKNPVRVIVIPTSPQLQATTANNPQIGFAPWADFTTDTELTVSRDHVVFVSTPLPEFIAQYNSMFSGIITPTQKLITP